MKKVLFSWMLGTLACAAQEAGQALDSVLRLDEVVLQAQRAGESPLGLVPSELITEQALALQNPIDFAGALNQVPGLYFQSGALNTNRISIRGVGARTPFGTNKLRMYYNDIPVTDGSGFSTLEAFDLEDLGTIRVVKGPKSASYGAALGGAVLLRSDPRKENGALVRNRLSAGSYGLFKNNLSLAFRDSALSGEVRYNRLTTQGYRENNAFDRDGLLMNLGWEASDTHHLTLLAQYIDYRAEIPSSLGKTAFETDPRQAAFTWAQAKGYEDNKYTLVGLSDRIALGDRVENTSSLFMSYLDHYEARPFNILDETNLGYGFRSVFRARLGNGSGTPAAELGGEYYRDRYAWATYENLYESNNGNGSLQGDLLSRNREYRKQLYLFGSLEWPINDRLQVRGALALNHTRYDFEDLYANNGDDRSAERNFDPILLPSLDVRYSTGNGSFAYLNLSRGFSNPSLEESLNPDGLVNPDIAQEKGLNAELGGTLAVPGARLLLTGALYLMDIRDLLVAERVGQDQYIGRNAGQTRHRGLELSAEYRQPLGRFAEVIPFLSYTLNDHKFREFTDAGEDYSGNELTGVPRHRVYAGLRLRGEAGWYWNGSFQYVDRMPLTDSNSLYSDAYRLVNMQLGYRRQLTSRLHGSLELGLNNLLNARYAGMVLINATAFGGAEPRYYYPGNGRNAYLGVLLLYDL